MMYRIINKFPKLVKTAGDKQCLNPQTECYWISYLASPLLRLDPLFLEASVYNLDRQFYSVDPAHCIHNLLVYLVARFSTLGLFQNIRLSTRLLILCGIKEFDSLGARH
jgi:hypothetical protein